MHPLPASIWGIVVVAVVIISPAATTASKTLAILTVIRTVIDVTGITLRAAMIEMTGTATTMDAMAVTGGIAAALPPPAVVADVTHLITEGAGVTLGALLGVAARVEEIMTVPLQPMAPNRVGKFGRGQH